MHQSPLPEIAARSILDTEAGGDLYDFVRDSHNRTGSRPATSLATAGIGSPRTFTSMALLRLDPTTGDALLSNAGHPFPLICTDGGSVQELDPSLPLGQGPSRQYSNTAFTIDRDTTLILFSDGLFEGARTPTAEPAASTESARFSRKLHGGLRQTFCSQFWKIGEDTRGRRRRKMRQRWWW